MTVKDGLDEQADAEPGCEKLSVPDEDLPSADSMHPGHGLACGVESEYLHRVTRHQGEGEVVLNEGERRFEVAETGVEVREELQGRGRRDRVGRGAPSKPALDPEQWSEPVMPHGYGDDQTSSTRDEIGEVPNEPVVDALEPVRGDNDRGEAPQVREGSCDTGIEDRVGDTRVLQAGADLIVGGIAPCDASTSDDEDALGVDVLAGHGLHRSGRQTLAACSNTR
jgi:hypothetical protein